VNIGTIKNNDNAGLFSDYIQIKSGNTSSISCYFLRCNLLELLWNLKKLYPILIRIEITYKIGYVKIITILPRRLNYAEDHVCAKELLKNKLTNLYAGILFFNNSKISE
jgi:hypothetical protein